MTRAGRDAASVIVAGVAASAIGALMYNVLPVYLGAAQDYRGLSTRQIGLIGTIFFTGFTVTTATGFFWIRRLGWRTLTISASLVGALGFSAATFGSSYELLLVGIFVAGGAFSIAYGVGTTALGDTSNPARWYGVKIAAEATVGAALLFFLPPTVIARWGFTGLIWSLVATVLVLAPLLLMLPKRPDAPIEGATISGTERATNRPAVWSALAGCLFFMCGETVLWSFIERIGAEAGFEPTTVGRLLAVTLVVALSGSFAAAALGGRFGTLKPVVIAHFCFFAAVVTLFNADDFTAYAVGACLTMFSVGLGLPFSITSAAERDRDGRYVVLTVPAIGIGMLVAPGAAGWLADAGGYTPVLFLGALCLAVSLAAFLAAHRLDPAQPGASNGEAA